MTSHRQHDAKHNKGAQERTPDSAKASDTGSAAKKTPPKPKPAEPRQR